MVMRGVIFMKNRKITNIPYPAIAFKHSSSSELKELFTKMDLISHVQFVKSEDMDKYVFNDSFSEIFGSINIDTDLIEYLVITDIQRLQGIKRYNFGFALKGLIENARNKVLIILSDTGDFCPEQDNRDLIGRLHNYSSTDNLIWTK